MATQQERQDEALTIAYRQLREAHAKLTDAAEQLARADWPMHSERVDQLAHDVEETTYSIERYALASGATL